MLGPQCIAAQLVDGRVSVPRSVIEHRQGTANPMSGKRAANRSRLGGQVKAGHRGTWLGEVRVRRGTQLAGQILEEKKFPQLDAEIELPPAIEFTSSGRHGLSSHGNKER